VTKTQQTYPDPVAGLMRLGDVRGQKEWRDYLALGFSEQHVADLGRMILDEELHSADGESDEVWSAVHAWRTLAQLQATSAIPALIELLGRIDEYDDDWTSEELPVVFGYLGQAALEPLRTFLAGSSQGMWSRVAAATSLAKIGERHPEVRADCVAALGRQLEQFAQQDPTFNGLLIGDLIDLTGVEAAPVIEQAYAANQVDLLIQGDWEDVQVYLGLLDERITPAPDLRPLLAKQMGFDPDELLGNLKALAQTKLQQKAERQAANKAKLRAKAKRKQAKKIRKKQRQRK
jgi:hypothetical protein